MFSGCSQFVDNFRENMRQQAEANEQAQAQRNEDECNQGSNCWNTLTTDQKIALLRVKVEQAKLNQMQQQAAQPKTWSQIYNETSAGNQTINTSCTHDMMGNMQCTSQ